MEADAPAQVPWEKTEDGYGEGAFAGPDFDEIEAASFFSSAGGPCGDGSGGCLGEHRGGGEIAMRADPGNTTGVVAVGRMMECPIHEFFERDWILEIHGMARSQNNRDSLRNAVGLMKFEIINRESSAGSRSGACFADDAVDRLGWLGTDGEPLIRDCEIDGVVDAFDFWIVGAELLDVTSVATLAAVNGDDFIVRAVFGALAVEADGYRHDRSFCAMPEDGRARKLQDSPENAKQNLEKLR